MDPYFIPKRLLSIQEPSLRLVNENECQEPSSRYGAFGYCWGGAEDASLQIKTTADTLAKRQSAIDTHSLTAVLRDAIFVAKTLSIPHIWVDSLCILQDDISDWEQQCLEVAAIYGNAYVTIIAASSTSCLEGFLQQRGGSEFACHFSRL